MRSTLNLPLSTNVKYRVIDHKDTGHTSKKGILFLMKVSSSGFSGRVWGGGGLRG